MRGNLFDLNSIHEKHLEDLLKARDENRAYVTQVERQNEHLLAEVGALRTQHAQQQRALEKLQERVRAVKEELERAELENERA